MDAQAKQLLLTIGNHLDAGIFPRVKNQGFVMPDESSGPLLDLGAEKSNVERQRREGPWKPGQPGSRRGQPRTRTWESGQPWASRPSGRPGPAGKAASVVGAQARSAYEHEVGGLQAIYPGAEAWLQEERMWLLVPSRLLPDLRQHALFLLGLSYPKATIRSWAFWADPFTRPTWIGPRHTNYPDGSICAYEPLDGTWTFGEALVDVLDLYSVWAVRHLHLLTFGRWPGLQAVHRPYERLLEIDPDEQCGCGQNRKYADCCRARDLAGDRIADAVDFLFWSGGGLRAPPPAVVDFATTKKDVERLDGFL